MIEHVATSSLSFPGQEDIPERRPSDPMRLTGFAGLGRVACGVQRWTSVTM
jgi:hypothetical protein